MKTDLVCHKCKKLAPVPECTFESGVGIVCRWCKRPKETKADLIQIEQYVEWPSEEEFLSHFWFGTTDDWEKRRRDLYQSDKRIVVATFTRQGGKTAEQRIQLLQKAYQWLRANTKLREQCVEWPSDEQFVKAWELRFDYQHGHDPHIHEVWIFDWLKANTKTRSVDKVRAEALQWHCGAPDKTYASEWFIAKLDNGDRVVLTALPEELSYDFKTADDTYYAHARIKCWMQFPDSQFVPHEAQNKVRAELDLEKTNHRNFRKDSADYVEQLKAQNRVMRDALEEIQNTRWSSEQVNPLKFIANEALKKAGGVG